MARKLRAGKMNKSARRLNPRSENVTHTKWKLTLCILLALAVVVCAYVLVSYIRTEHVDGGVEVIVGNHLMACIDPESIVDGENILNALEKVSVRPTSNQTIELSGPTLELQLNKEDVEDLSLRQDGKDVLLIDAYGVKMGIIDRIYLPIDK